MKNESAVQFATRSRVHVGREVEDLEKSIAFYRVLFAREPSKTRPGYAKFEPADPPVNLSLIEGSGAGSGRPLGASHFGIQVKSVEDVERAADRLRTAGVSVRLEEQSTCCYAVQTKVWAEDPDGNPWEVFVVLEADADRRADESSACCSESCCSE